MKAAEFQVVKDARRAAEAQLISFKSMMAAQTPTSLTKVASAATVTTKTSIKKQK